jgi:type VI secretion system secreted protein Hcp
MSTEPSPDALYGEVGLAPWQPEAPFSEWEGEPSGEWESEPAGEWQSDPAAEWEGEPSGEWESDPAGEWAQGADEAQLLTPPLIHRTALATPVAVAPPTSISGPFYVRIVGGKQGPFAGHSSDRSHEGWLLGRGFQQQLTSPLDPATGLPSGKRVYAPIVVALEWSPASPQIFTALVTNESLPSVTLEFVGAGANGIQHTMQRLTLTNARISALRRTKGLANGVPDGQAPLEWVSFAFQKLTLDDLTSSRTAADDWSAPTTELETGEAGELDEAGELPRTNSWATDTYELQRAGVRPCVEGASYLA